MEYVQPIRDKKILDTMKKVLRSSNLRDYNLFILGINSGLRISDLLNLKVSDVCDEKGKIKDRIVIREKKTNKLKDFPLGETSKKALNLQFAYNFFHCIYIDMTREIFITN